MRAQKNISYVLPLKVKPYINEGPRGYLLRLAEINLLDEFTLKNMGVIFDYEVLVNQEILINQNLEPQLHQYVSRISQLKEKEIRVWNEQHARFCPICLSESEYWKVEWELNFYDVCHQHGVWLIDQCSSCGKKHSWNRSQLKRCNCGANLEAETATPCPPNMQMLASVLSNKIVEDGSIHFPKVFMKTNIEQTQRLIRYLGNYMSLASGKNPLKMRNASDLTQSWNVTTLAAEIIADWPNAFHQGLTVLERKNRAHKIPRLNDVFGAAYHYVFKALKEKPFEEFRYQFEVWITNAWKGGVAKRNKRLTSTLLGKAVWIPASAACDLLGISHQRLELLIRDGSIEGETYISRTGRKSVMVRRDNLDQVKNQLFGMIDMTTARRLLGLEKRRMRQLLTLIFKDAKKLGTSYKAPWEISRLEVNKLLDISNNLEVVSIPDEGCYSFGHVLKYWTWSNEEISGFIFAVCDQEILPVNILETAAGLAAWNFKEAELKNWKQRHVNGMGSWLTITQAAKVLGIKEQVAYELVKLDFLKSEVMPKQIKRGTRIRRTTIEDFNKNYIFATKIAETMNCSPRKVISHFEGFQILPISGPMVDGARQVLYKLDQISQYLPDGKVEIDYD